MARKPSPPAPRPADWTPEQTYTALKKQLVALDGFRGKTYRDVEHHEQEWMNLTLNILTHGFGESANKIKQFHQAKWAGEHHVNMDEGEIQQNFNERIEAFAATLRSSLAELELMGAGAEQVPPAGRGVLTVKSDSRDIFLVHGRDDAMKESVARFLEKLDLHTVILHEQPNMGRTVIEKFEAHSDVGFAVVLLTPDDVGGLASEGNRTGKPIPTRFFCNPDAKPDLTLEP
jgi:hypothetical protein